MGKPQLIMPDMSAEDKIERIAICEVDDLKDQIRAALERAIAIGAHPETVDGGIQFAVNRLWEWGLLKNKPTKRFRR
jgi:hypothetical protein